MVSICDTVEEEDYCECLARVCPTVYDADRSRDELESCYMDACFISKRALEDSSLIRVTIIYSVILVVGIAGNVCTCIVIRTHTLLRVHSNRYLLNLAIADLVTLCVGLPFEIYTSWHQYPWPLPDFVCNLKAWIAEATSCVSVTTILMFAIERYIAICHPLIFLKLKRVREQVSYLERASASMSTPLRTPNTSLIDIVRMN